MILKRSKRLHNDEILLLTFSRYILKGLSNKVGEVFCLSKYDVDVMYVLWRESRIASKTVFSL